MIESSVGTIGSWSFGTDEVAVLTSKAEDNPSLGVVLEEEELLQNEDEQLNEDETAMSHMQEIVATNSKEELACSNSPKNIEEAVWKTVGATTAVEN